MHDIVLRDLTYMSLLYSRRRRQLQRKKKEITMSSHGNVNDFKPEEVRLE